MYVSVAASGGAEGSRTTLDNAAHATKVDYIKQLFPIPVSYAH